MDEKYPFALPQGTVLAGQYIIEKVLGQGGFGITYVATDYKSSQKVAVKEFFPNNLVTRTKLAVTPYNGEYEENFRYGLTCFLQEAKMLASFIGNEHIVGIHTYFEENATAYFVMDFIEGVSFDVYLKQHGGKVDYPTAEKIFLPIIEALAAVHKNGIIHRDVTPDNIYITKDGTIKLLDFGSARYSIGDKSRSLDVVLKRGFAPKEQYTRHGKQGPFTDVYSLGASFYFALTGKRPPDSIDRIEEDRIVLPSRLGAELPKAKEDAILKALEVQPGRRFQTMDEFKDALLGNSITEQKISKTVPEAEERPAVTEPVSLEEAAESSAPKGKWLPVILVSVVLAVALLIVLLVVLSKKGKNYSYTGGMESFSTAEAGDIVTFGVYEQDTLTANGKEGIEWLVLERRGDRLLLLSRYILEAKPYNTKYAETTWKSCSLRSWLNNEFYNAAFADTEKKYIRTSVLDNQGNLYYGTEEEGQTKDKLFLLSLDDMRVYFHFKEYEGIFWDYGGDKNLLAKGTRQAYKSGLYLYNEEKEDYYSMEEGYEYGADANGMWWLRSPGGSGSDAVYINGMGVACLDGYNVSVDKLGVRPALWLDLKP